MSLADTEKQTLAKPDKSSSSSSSSSTSSTSFDLNSQSCIEAAAGRAEVVFHGKKEEPLAIVIRNVDGANGKLFLRLKQIQQQILNFGAKTAMKMAGKQSLTSGSGMANDVYDVLSYGPSEDRSVVSFAQAVLANIGAAGSIFSNNLCSLDVRFHKYPMSMTGGILNSEARRGIQSMCLIKPADAATSPFWARKPEDREGGRIHPHADRKGTEAVTILNIGNRAQYILCSPPTTSKTGNTGCENQLSKECWCTAGTTGRGHWAKKEDAKERYGEGKYKWVLENRLCQPCATDGMQQGQSCEKCTVVVVNSGDMLILHGSKVVHGINLIINDEQSDKYDIPSSLNPKDTRVSIQWRLSTVYSKMNIIRTAVRESLRDILIHVGYTGMIQVEASRQGYSPTEDEINVINSVVDWNDKSHRSLRNQILDSIVGKTRDVMEKMNYLFALELLLNIVMALDQLIPASCQSSYANKSKIHAICSGNGTPDSPSKEVLQRESEGTNGLIFFARRMVSVAWSQGRFSQLLTSVMVGGEMSAPPDAPELLKGRLPDIASLCKNMVNYIPSICLAATPMSSATSSTSSSSTSSSSSSSNNKRKIFSSGFEGQGGSKKSKSKDDDGGGNQEEQDYQRALMNSLRQDTPQQNNHPNEVVSLVSSSDDDDDEKDLQRALMLSKKGNLKSNKIKTKKELELDAFWE